MVQSQARIYEENELVLDRQAPALTLCEEPEEDFQMYRIADLNVAVRGKRFQQQGLHYKSTNASSQDIVIDINEINIKELMKSDPYMTYEEAAYIATATRFNKSILEFDCIVLHASAVVLNECAYLFSAPKGTGKSTHTSLWIKRFGELAYILNDDKPVIRYVNNRLFVYGTPWSGKSDLNVNRCAALKGIVFIEQAKENWIHRISNNDEAVFHVLDQVYRSKDADWMDRLLILLNKIIPQIPIYNMGCTISQEAVNLAFEFIESQKNQ